MSASTLIMLQDAKVEIDAFEKTNECDPRKLKPIIEWLEQHGGNVHQRRASYLEEALKGNGYREEDCDKGATVLYLACRSISRRQRPDGGLTTAKAVVDHWLDMQSAHA